MPKQIVLIYESLLIVWFPRIIAYLSAYLVGVLFNKWILFLDLESEYDEKA